MNNITKASAIALSLATLSGCNIGWSKQQCQQTNWYNMGRNNGSNGSPTALAPIAKQCSQYGVAINRAAYNKGYQYGLRHYFCTTQNGIRWGHQGKNYNGQCPPAYSRAFIQGWRQGLRSYCVPAVVRESGLNGKPFPTWCPSNTLARLRVAYNKGSVQRQRHNLSQRQVQEVRNQINLISQRINQLQRQGVSSTAPQMMRLESRRDALREHLYEVEKGTL